jgi:FkbM family methyltransferase
VDVGANIGYFTLMAAAFGCRVLALEPIPKAMSLLNYAVHLNKFSDRVQLLPIVAGNEKIAYGNR